MNKKFRWSLLLAFFTVVLIGLVSAGNVKISAYEAGETIYKDINGNGKKESIRVTYTTKGNSVDRATLLINGKEVAVLSAGSKTYDRCTVSVLDIYSKDKYKEVVVEFNCEGSDFTVFRYDKKGNLTKLFSAEFSGKHVSAKDCLVTQTKKNRVTFIETVGGPFGCVYVSKVYKYSTKTQKLKLTSYTSVATYKPKHTSVVSANIYTSLKFDSVAGLLGKKEDFTIKKIRQDKKGNVIAAYVRTSGGVKGWINVKDFKENVIVANPIYW
ncbi:MAG: hypothetical protein IKP88_08630 [Lachnospiraceae bacterium]|nr:hypothetical protein [Lachnospiraceae bacterium]